MVRQFRIEHLQGVEVLVCEFYAKHTWNKQEMDAYLHHLEGLKLLNLSEKCTQDDFRIELDEWLKLDRAPGDTFCGLTAPIPVYDYSPHMVIRGAIVDNKVASFSCDFAASVSQLEVLDGVHVFFDFIRSPHWRNTIAMSVPSYGSLFASDNDSQSR